IDGDVIFDAGMVRVWKQRYAFMTGTGAAPGWNDLDLDRSPTPLALGRVISPMMAAKKGYGLPFPLPLQQMASARARTESGVGQPEVVPADWNSLQTQLRRRQSANLLGACNYSSGMRSELALAAIALADAEGEPARDDGAGV